eukprot:Tamp_38117.p1 GENE.Tamp_38117~~Tamp_38117.p1  ORF type:complete len:139 (+),score=19.57 Tamp_38117:33-419(+)
MRKGALKRRNAFATKADVAAYMRSRYAFKAFDARAMDEYIEYGTRQNSDGTGYTLKCQPSAEAAVYAGRVSPVSVGRTHSIHKEHILEQNTWSCVCWCNVARAACGNVSLQSLLVGPCPVPAVAVLCV